jgi:hypothetical protein
MSCIIEELVNGIKSSTTETVQNDGPENAFPTILLEAPPILVTPSLPLSAFGSHPKVTHFDGTGALYLRKSRQVVRTKSACLSTLAEI